MECGSARIGKLPEGCVRCIEGSKMVLLVTGKCGWNCDYCPISAEKKGKDVVYANESRVSSDADIVAEAKAMNARGAGITGGDPMFCFDRTVRLIKLLKNEFGPDFHIHLYTATVDPEKVRMLEEAGLDEIRFHPTEENWTSLKNTRLPEITGNTGMKVGLEIPALPGKEKEIVSMIRDAKTIGIDFVNLNELEFSESNWSMMDIHGYGVKDDISSAVAGSEETAMKVLKSCKGYNIHFCSSSFKDGIQLRRRLIRRAMNVSARYQQITEDGTVIRGFVKGNPEEVKSVLIKMKVSEDLFAVTEDGAEVAPWILEKIANDLQYEAWLSEQYPTADMLEVEKTPLNR